MTITYNDFQMKVWLDRYALKDANGQPVEKHPNDTYRRVAKAIAEQEEEPKREHWQSEFYRLMSEGLFIPGGRVLSGAGSGHEVTYYNCYVAPSPLDSRSGIFDNLRLMADIMARGGGVGVNLSTIRPRGSYIKTVNGYASGPVSWAELYSVTTGDVISQGGSRRGALMLMLNDDHPDIEEFITAKRDTGKLQYCNMSVAISDAFMDAVKKNSDWHLNWQGQTVKTLKARDLWSLICKSAWESGEPGVVFLERYNEEYNGKSYGQLTSVNPCLSGDTLLLTDDGLRPIKELEGTQFLIESEGKWYETTAWKTGTKPVYRLTLSNGQSIKATADHRIGVNRLNETNIYDVPLEKCLGIQVDVQRGRGWSGGADLGLTPDKWTFLGFLQGDGCFRHDCDAISVNIGSKDGDVRFTLPSGGVDHSERTVYYRSDHPVVDWAKTAGLKRVSLPERDLPDSIFTLDTLSTRAFLRGLFSANGSVINQRRIALKSTCHHLVEQVQQILLALGIQTYITTNKSKAVEFSNGKYQCRESYDLNVCGNSTLTFMESIGFIQQYKSVKVGKSGFARKPKVVSIEYVGEEDVYDFSEPETHHGWANGFLVHNCGEVGLEPYGVCNLGSINLAAHVKAGAVDYDLLKQTVRSAVRFLDNVIDATPYFLPENEKIQKSLRRVGLGSMGLADAMLLCKVKYGSQESLNFCENVYSSIADQAYIASAMLARERKPFPLWTGQFYYDAPFISRLGDEADDAVYNYGLRNVAILAQAPTGTTSMLLGVSSGIEPNFAWKVRRKDRLGERVIYHPIYGDWMSGYSEDGADVYQKVPDYFVTAAEIAPEDHIRVQAMVQKYTDQSISKTINAPNSSTVEDVERAYMLAYDLGCKGVTYFRDGSREGVLSDATQKQEANQGNQDQSKEVPLVSVRQQATDGQAPVANSQEASSQDVGGNKSVSAIPTERPDSPLPGLTYRVRVPLEDGDTTNVYITITGIDGKPVEVFLNSGASNRADHDIIARLVSHSLRTGVPLEEVIDNCWKVRGYVPLFTKGCKKPITCVANAIGYCLEQWRLAHSMGAATEKRNDCKCAATEKTILEQQRALFDSEQEYQEVKQEFESKGLLCPQCGNYSVYMQSGCPTCTNCAYSKCG
jgi:ribonucleoside-diphosphate reductase alpha chain